MLLQSFTKTQALSELSAVICVGGVWGDLRINCAEIITVFDLTNKWYFLQKKKFWTGDRGVFYSLNSVFQEDENIKCFDVKKQLLLKDVGSTIYEIGTICYDFLCKV